MKRAKRQVKSYRGFALSERIEAKGFTILETIMYLASLIILVGAVTALLVWIVRVSGEVHVRNELVASLEHATFLMANEIREAERVYAPTSTTTQLSLHTRNNVPALETSTYVDFFLCDTRLCIKREFQAPQALTPEQVTIQNLEFTHVQTGSATSSSSSVHIVIEASYRDASQSSQTTVSLRSYE